MADGWKPQLAAGVNLTSLQLTAVEGFALSRVDGRTTEHELALLTGLSDAQVQALVLRLEAEGVLVPRPGSVSEAPLVDADVEPEPEPEPVADSAEETATGASLLKLYRAKFHELPGGEREQLATTATGAELSALCFDPLPAVVRRILENPRCGPEQARLIAAHHPSSTGLEMLINRADLARDGEVQRKLWRNPQLNEAQVKRLTAAKRLLEVWKLSVSRESTAQTRNALMRTLRTKFSSASADERVELIFMTEGRPLASLSGLPVDGRTTALLCGRTYSSMLLVQNIAHWSAAPPALIAHLMKQPMVMRQPRIKKMLEQHPNAPSRDRSG
ncbi:MAG: hypothetical protein IPJ65_43890 [Archangiaceae bacterium]|nr:hypothetical protein [Archangiaceae bacterium]